MGVRLVDDPTAENSSNLEHSCLQPACITRPGYALAVKTLKEPRENSTILDVGSSAGSLFSHVWANEAVDPPGVGGASPTQWWKRTVPLDLNFFHITALLGSPWYVFPLVRGLGYWDHKYLGFALTAISLGMGQKLQLNPGDLAKNRCPPVLAC